jgi:hypothetical protein
MSGPTAVLLIDVINFAFDGAAALIRAATPASRRIASLARRAREAHIVTALHGDVRASSRIDFESLARKPRKPRGQRF